ncbi:hypothetical protein ACLB2K_075155 [Fragaria x ananassa]
MHTKFKRVASTANPRHQQGLLPSAHRQRESLDLVVVFVVLDKLLEPIDLVRFGAVCKQWGRFAQDYKQIAMSIVLPSVSKPRSNTHCRRYYRGCVHGWVAMIDMDVDGMGVIITLVNPFTTAMLQLVRPMFIYGIPKVISLGDPTSNSGVQLIFSDEMSWIQVGGRQRQAWKNCQPHYLLDDPNDLLDHVCKFTDAIFYRGQIYMADCSNYGIVVIDYEDLDQNKIVYASPPSAVVDSLNFPQRAERAYLVESIKGDLFYIRRFTKLNSIQMVTESFRVYKVVLNGSIVEYVEVKSIGDEAFFVGDSPSVSVLASSSSGCQPNSIYFTDDSINYSIYSANYFDENLQVENQNSEVQVDMGVLHLEDGTISQHYPKYSFDGRLLPPPFWIMLPAV